MTVRVIAHGFDPGGQTNLFLKEHNSAGAVVTFTGLVRSSPSDPITSLMLECYPDLAINQVETILAQGLTRFELLAATIIHRYGTMVPGDPIVQVMTMSPHREAAFEGAQFLMDYLKTDAPFWKKETGPTGTKWVDAKSADDRAKARWK
ncbi:molybdenum cofactor biosynthesis protein MoaE [Devosia rhodophyticola]|uniref:Molybdopterin synthase catalytic subunit n=1 Tax=Devosia rhodophyticola TaxID=3026423 RepID=A0ABY7YUV6_9HYPH|nr:molybdenum cofactor biosynthesis protein MoaE [Devosia rhodophyticola]WDR05084.1 molybdenum cofactor biosynthesis protein MoaE [Devosia rhodophyticola]